MSRAILRVIFAGAPFYADVSHEKDGGRFPPLALQPLAFTIASTRDRVAFVTDSEKFSWRICHPVPYEFRIVFVFSFGKFFCLVPLIEFGQGSNELLF